MINLLCAFRRDDHPIGLNQEFFLDLAWWQEFFQSWNNCSFLQYPSGLHFPTSRFLQMPLGLLVTEQSSRVTGFQVHGSQHRSLSLSSTRNFSLSSWQLTSGVPSGPANGSTSYQITAQWWTFCGLALQEPLPSCPWFAICPCWQLVTPSRSLPPQLEGSLTPLLTPCLAFSFSAFAG